MDGEVKTAKNHNGRLALICTTFGLCAGAALGVLYAPRSGNETRIMLKDKLHSMRQNKAGRQPSQTS